MRMKRFCMCVLPALLVLGMGMQVSASGQNTYWYTTDRKAVSVPDSYTLSYVTEMKNEENASTLSLTDFDCDAAGNVYVLDGGEGKIFCLDQSFQVTRVMDSFQDAQGNLYTLNKPEGIFVDQHGQLIVADTQNHRILKMTTDGQVVQELGPPDKVESLEEGQEYLPSKVVSDASDRLYVVATGINMGFLELDASGGFISYIGAPPVSTDPFTLFWRRFSTEEQLNRMNEFIPTEYNNVAIDSEGFLYGTIGSLDDDELSSVIRSKDKSGRVTPIRRLSPSGDDILRRQGTYPPVGSLEEGSVSRIVDVAVGVSDTYALLDGQAGRIFTYDVDGNLLCAFGEIGSRKGQFGYPVALRFIGDSLAVLDQQLGQLLVFELTTYGRLMNEAVTLNWEGKFEESYAKWAELFALNPTFDQAYIGMGKSYYRLGDYEQAMECFRTAGDKENYDKAFQAYRKDKLGAGFGYIFVGIAVLLVGLLIWGIVRRIVRYVKEEE